METILDALEIDSKLQQMADEIVERNNFASEIILIGIERRGVPLAHRLAEKIQNTSSIHVQVGRLDITLYGERHKVIAKYPILNGTDIPFSIDDRCVILVDDILYTGKTIITALQELLQHGKPEEVQLAVFVDHGCRSFPICANYIGIKTGIQPFSRVVLRMKEVDECEDQVLLLKQFDSTEKNQEAL